MISQDNMIVEVKKLNYHPGHCRQYYSCEKILLCRFFDKETGKEKVDEWYRCSKDGEPSHPISFKKRIRIKFI